MRYTIHTLLTTVHIMISVIIKKMIRQTHGT